MSVTQMNHIPRWTSQYFFSWLERRTFFPAYYEAIAISAGSTDEFEQVDQKPPLEVRLTEHKKKKEREASCLPLNTAMNENIILSE